MKKFILGFILGSLCFGGLAIQAHEGKWIQISYNIKDIKINNVSQMPKENPPFLYNDTTYVPLRYLTTALNIPISWDPNSNTININTKYNENTFLIGRDIFYSNYEEGNSGNSINQWNKTDALRDLLGATYETGLAFYLSSKFGETRGWSIAEYEINEGFNEFHATLGFTSESKETKEKVNVVIYKDNQEVYKKEIQRTSVPSKFNIDIKNAKKLKIKVYKTTSNWTPVEVALFDAKFTR